MAKKNNSRKALAAALAIVGVAGLSMASASQLTVDAGDNIATGFGTFDAACDTSVEVSLDTVWNGTAKVHDVDGFTIDDIAAGCENLTLEWRLYDDADVEVENGSLTVGASGSESVTLTSAFDGTDTLGDIAITIS